MADGSALTVLFLGMAGAFSLPPLEALIAAGIRVSAVVMPGSTNRQVTPPKAVGLTVLAPYPRRNIVHVAWEHAIPVWEVADLSAPDILALVPDVIAVACFDRLLPRRLWSRAALAVNVHPSLLPRNRGPAPLFWTLRLREPITGVTVHLLDDRADAGPIAAQRELPVPDGADPDQLEHDLAVAGGVLLVEVLREFASGTLQPRPQDETQATSYPWPNM
jgi:methionyl-tRNA formyltransferase